MSYPQDTIRRRVRRGVKLLDEYGPKDWRKRINVEALDITSTTCCVLAQVYRGKGAHPKNYYQGLDKLTKRVGHDFLPVEAGFNAVPCPTSAEYGSWHEYAERLNETWRRELQSV